MKRARVRWRILQRLYTLPPSQHPAQLENATLTLLYSYRHLTVAVEVLWQSRARVRSAEGRPET